MQFMKQLIANFGRNLPSVTKRNLREAEQRRPRPALFDHGLGREVEDEAKKLMTQFSRRKVKSYERTFF